MQQQVIDKKIKTLVICTLLIGCIIIARLVQLQVHLKDLFVSKSMHNFLKLETVPSPRGNIIDQHGNLLATNRPVYSIEWKGTGNYRLSAEQNSTISYLEKILDTSLDKKIQSISRAERYRKTVKIAADISFEKLSKLEEYFCANKNITITTDFQRFYPHQKKASHILGYLGKITIKQLAGKMGLEKLFNESLQGKDGIKQKTINSLGKKLQETSIEKALSGKTVQTTLDLKMQTIVEEIFPKDESGTCILMDPQDGALIAVVSYPHFDPTLFLSPILNNEWSLLQKNNPFLNRAFNAEYPPGSIFKLISVAAALENNLVTEDTTWDCKGFLHFGKRKYFCHRRWGHGQVTIGQALEKSCNICFYDIAKQLPIDILADYAQRFGLGQKTNILFPEKAGLVPTTQWKLEKKGERWWPGETLSAIIGQSFLLTTPLQIARMIGSIFTGYLVKPRILTSEEIQKEPLNLKEETRLFLQQSMKKVVTQGTARRVNKIDDMEIYAKTSTAQTSSFSKRFLGKKYKEHGWFVMYFKHKNKQPLVMIVLVEHAGTSRVPALIAKRFLTHYKKL